MLKFTMTGWKLVFLSVAVAALMLQDTASARPGELLLNIQSNDTNFTHIIIPHLTFVLTCRCDGGPLLSEA